MSTEHSSKEKKLYCPECGKGSVLQNKCSECEWVGCEHDDHDFHYESDQSVGIFPHLLCEDCGIAIDYDGRFDEQDWTEYP